MKWVFAGVLASAAAYVIGSVVELESGVNLPGFGIALTVITMGAVILFRLRDR